MYWGNGLQKRAKICGNWAKFAKVGTKLTDMRGFYMVGNAIHAHLIDSAQLVGNPSGVLR